jgi:hypothetical protein
MITYFNKSQIRSILFDKKVQKNESDIKNWLSSKH